ncbi:MAG: methyltransferase domain-containing protein [Candidatus Binatia bacterium]|nr:methyltransferase domain-containing protein [Candidatus Binatia bacterium]
MAESASLARGPAHWDPQQYQRFSRERSRPFFELLARVPDGEVRAVADLGCGPGNLTYTLLTRWPEAHIWGVDHSPEMLAQAAALPVHPHLRFVQADLAQWRPDVLLDRIIANAALHWVPHHATLLPRLVSFLAPRGVLAVQMPYNCDAPSHRLLAEVVAQEPWRSALGGWTERYFVEAPLWYADTLHALGCTVDLWETTYYHVLMGPDAVLEWMKGTALRPVLSRLDHDRQAQFLEVYREKLRAAYPEGPYGACFPFRRVFFVAQLR